MERADAVCSSFFFRWIRHANQQRSIPYALHDVVQANPWCAYVPIFTTGRTVPNGATAFSVIYMTVQSLGSSDNTASQDPVTR